MKRYEIMWNQWYRTIECGRFMFGWAYSPWRGWKWFWRH